VDQYVEDLCLEIRLQPPKANISTVFFGGGTPSLLNPHHVSQILGAVRSHLYLDPDAEITLEANPESVTLEKASGWHDAGINRISIGLQAFDDGLLKKMDRLHNVKEFLDAYRSVRDAGFTNVSVDLIYGFAEQTLEDWKKTLQSTVALQPEHLSLYALKIEDHTPFAARQYKVNDDHEASMYEWARGYLKAEGFEQYEISNFSRPGKACRHNLIYWRQQDYLGLGVGAVGCVDGVRWENHKNLLDYHRDVKKELSPRVSTENLDFQTRQFERLMLGLRLREGLLWNESSPEWLAKRSSLAARGLLEETHPGHWRIPDAVVPLTNQVLIPFL
jgi:oxygen-independent coproporphyrinogen-3 oxidase